MKQNSNNLLPKNHIPIFRGVIVRIKKKMAIQTVNHSASSEFWTNVLLIGGRRQFQAKCVHRRLGQRQFLGVIEH